MPTNFKSSLFQATAFRNTSQNSSLVNYFFSGVTKNSASDLLLIVFLTTVY
jgi:hypothetical protein